jgi:hypothetical protein
VPDDFEDFTDLSVEYYSLAKSVGRIEIYYGCKPPHEDR